MQHPEQQRPPEADAEKREGEERFTEHTHEYRNAAGELVCTAVETREQVERETEDGKKERVTMLRSLALRKPESEEVVDVFAVAGLAEGGYVSGVKIVEKGDDAYATESREVRSRAPDNAIALGVLLHEAGHAEQYNDGSALREVIGMHRDAKTAIAYGDIGPAAALVEKIVASVPDARIERLEELQRQLVGAAKLREKTVAEMEPLWQYKDAVIAERKEVSELMGWQVQYAENTAAAQLLFVPTDAAERRAEALKAGIDLSGLPDDAVTDDTWLRFALGFQRHDAAKRAPAALRSQIREDGMLAVPVNALAHGKGVIGFALRDPDMVRRHLAEIESEGPGGDTRAKFEAAEKRLDQFTLVRESLQEHPAMRDIAKVMERMKERDATARALRWMKNIRDQHGIDLLQDTVVAKADTFVAPSADQDSPESAVGVALAEATGDCAADEAGPASGPEYLMVNPRDNLRAALDTYRGNAKDFRGLAKGRKRLPRAVRPPEEPAGPGAETA